MSEPILNILFGLERNEYSYIPWDTIDTSFKDIFINNFYWYISSIIDKFGPTQTLMILGVTLVVMTFLKTGSSYLASFFMIPIRTGVVRDIRNNIFSKILSLPIGFFTSEKKGDVMARMTGDVAEVETSIMASLDMLFKNPVMIIFYLLTMIPLSWTLNIFVLIL